jgi:hypothetical protein
MLDRVAHHQFIRGTLRATSGKNYELHTASEMSSFPQCKNSNLWQKTDMWFVPWPHTWFRGHLGVTWKLLEIRVQVRIRKKQKRQGVWNS